VAQHPAGEDPVLDAVVRRLVEVYHPERIYLFGSAARGDANRDSDYDVMVIVPDDAPAERRSSGPAYTALWGGEGAVAPSALSPTAAVSPGVVSTAGCR
jgi:hypothetical protein